MATHRNKAIAIIGGGIGGIAAALALHRIGVDVLVYERAEQLREIGAGMMLWPNATRVLKEMGVLEDVVQRGGHNTNFLVRSSRGRILMNIALGQFEVPAVCIRRSDLLSILLSALPAKCLKLGYEFEHLKQIGRKVRIYFRNGCVEEHDAAVGADGIRSRVKSELFGASDPIYRGYVVWRGLAQYDGSAIAAGFNSESWGKGMRFGILSTGHQRFTWYATANISSPYVHGAWEQKRELKQLFAGWHEPVADFLEATEESEILKNGARDCRPLRQWGKGMVTLLGDAAHPCTPNLGQGGCMALEDALVLAKNINREPSLQIALRSYESLRIHRTRHIQQRSLLMGCIGQWRSPLFVTGRKVITQMLPVRLIERNLRRVYSYAAA